MGTNQSEFFPFIQSHFFDVGPYLKQTQGYAPFIASSKFTGHEQVRIKTSDGSFFPDTGTTERRLNEFSSGQWFLPDHERVVSATSGALKTGKYIFIIESTDANTHIEFEHAPHFLDSVRCLNLQKKNDAVEVSWNAPQHADNYWIFAIPCNARSFIEQLKPLTANMITSQINILKMDTLNTGEYQIVVRANRMWRNQFFRGFQSESWTVSTGKFNVP